jgi:hypothetical protein
VARLLIPRLGLDEIVLEGVDDFALNAGPGHLPGSAFPGEAGNSIISAHRDRHFAGLGAIEPGDTVVTESGTHRTEAATLRRLALALEQRNAALAAIPPSVVPRPDANAREEEMQRLRDELAAANAELDRIRRRVSRPRP